MQIYIDGDFYPESEAKVSVFDHGLLYGDGVFEGIRFYKGRVFRLEEHISRLYKSASAIHLKIPLERKTLTAALLDTICQTTDPSAHTCAALYRDLTTRRIRRAAQ